jgi:hypothetical protein
VRKDLSTLSDYAEFAVLTAVGKERVLSSEIKCHAVW